MISYGQTKYQLAFETTNKIQLERFHTYKYEQAKMLQNLFLDIM